MAESAIGETEMYGLLRQRLCKDSGNGPQTVLVPGVRSAAGFDARRTIDAVSLGLWPSRGMLLDGYEIKVSRSDWLRELKDPAKAEEFAGLVDRLWLVVSDSSIVKDGELPGCWGLLVRHGEQLRQKVAAEKLHEGKGLPPRFTRTFLVPLLRAANAIPPEERDKLRDEAGRSTRFDLEHTREKLSQLEEQVAAFEAASGVKVGNRYDFQGTAEDRGAAFKAALNGGREISVLQQRAASLAASFDGLADQARELAPDTENPEPGKGEQ